MVKTKDKAYIDDQGHIDIEKWQSTLTHYQKQSDLRLIHNACVLAKLAGEHQPTLCGQSCLEQGLQMADILADLHIDAESLAAAIVYLSTQYADLTLDDIEEHLGPAVAKLIEGVENMEAIENLYQSRTTITNHKNQIEKVRKMLLAMVEDVRVALIKLADQLTVLRAVAKLGEHKKKQAAELALHIYAPLANRLGVSQLKWEMEDLAFRFSEPEKYKDIAKLLDSRRIDREHFIKDTIAELEAALKAQGLHRYNVTGRAKHIYSIYRKMQRKSVDFKQIYDALAIRILVDDIEGCYTALSVAHSLYEHVPEEFDDYIKNKKPNGYQSIHTALTTPTGKVFEIQIRTFDMHQFAELGVAAHWMYKESAKKSRHDNRINWLRQVLAWHKELSDKNEPLEELSDEIAEDRVYAFTPTGEVVDLPLGATPLDFAYYIHSEVGHRCRGAKVNGAIVPLTYKLKTGEQIEILTAKLANPSRDWLNPNLGYIISPRARAKLHAFFKKVDYDSNVSAGQDILDRELKRINLSNVNMEQLAHKLHFNNDKDMLAALGNGDLRTAQVLNCLQQRLQDSFQKKPVIKTQKPTTQRKPQGDIHIAGTGNLLTHIARCCKPVPGDPIVGYITLGRGVSIHKQDCANVLRASESRKERFLEVSWESGTTENYPVDLAIEAHDRHGLLRDITAILTNEKVNLTSLKTVTDQSKNTAYMTITIEIFSLEQLSRIMDKCHQVPNVYDVKRTS